MRVCLISVEIIAWGCYIKIPDRDLLQQPGTAFQPPWVGESGICHKSILSK